MFAAESLIKPLFTFAGRFYIEKTPWRSSVYRILKDILVLEIDLQKKEYL